jgi:hypothetical protein
MITTWTWNVNILFPELATISLVVYFLIGISIMIAFAVTIAITSRMFDGTFGKFMFKWSMLTIVLCSVLLANDLLHIFVFK